MTYRINDIEGIGSQYTRKLAQADIGTTDKLLQSCRHPAGRRKVSERTGINERLLLKWSNHADLMRISGVGPQFAELLEAAGVDTVRELRNRNSHNLAEKMRDVNTRKRLTRVVPSETLVEDWVGQARSLRPMITH